MSHLNKGELSAPYFKGRYMESITGFYYRGYKPPLAITLFETYIINKNLFFEELKKYH
tara:strand:- start:1139 stop:1312 length:174 start_codon:yes stop_codon:yes gene_type:complete